MTEPTDSTEPGQINAPALPIVTLHDGQAIADSRDVAAFFGKVHFQVLRDVRNLHCSDDFRQSNFVAFKVNDLSGESTSHVTMTKDGFTFLAMGFTGEKAGKFKEAYIERFNVMEAELRSRHVMDPMTILGDPAAMRGLLLVYTEKVIALQAANAELTPKAEALDRIANSDGALSITEAAKALQVRPKDLFGFLSSNGWTYRRPGGSAWLGYQVRTSAGLLEHKVTTVLRADGSEKVVEQVKITPRGLTKLANLIPNRP
jgi:Rha family phage regulatory protein